uniref:Uncharacterized protein n=1 Tax=Rhizophora mucronata TaxID=61149 RepID=A0A2P2QHQ8_RHIMU
MGKGTPYTTESSSVDTTP